MVDRRWGKIENDVKRERGGGNYQERKKNPKSSVDLVSYYVLIFRG